MSKVRRLVVAGIVVAVVAGVATVIGVTAFSHGNETGGPTPTSIPLPGTPDEPEVLAGGSYLISDPFPIPVTLTAPAKWTGDLAGEYAAFLRSPASEGRATIALSLSQKIYADPCSDKGFISPQPGPTVGDLASTLTHLPGLVATTPTEVTDSGVRGEKFTLTAPDSPAKCQTPDGYRLWVLPFGHVFSITPGQTMSIWILETAGTRMVVSSQLSPTATAKDKAAVRAILASIQIGAGGP
jgi:hypothetical protein